MLVLTSGLALAQADESSPDMEVWLVSYGPGDISWQRFGHNAIWIRDQELGLNHVFNFGFFDFEQEGFYRRFLQGKLWYFSAAQPAEREFSQYINENRSIRAQKLNLSAGQSLRLVDYLLREIEPQNREYLYDYYTHNCSTRIRDALDLALGGDFKADYEIMPAKQTWRDHTRRLTIEDFWLYLGLELGLGSPIDQTINRWQELFIPAQLATAVADYKPGGEALVVEDIMIFESTLKPPLLKPMPVWPRYLLMSMLILACSWLALFLLPSLRTLRLVQIWLVFAGMAGSVLVFFWFFTDHQATQLNLNLLVLNPLFWLLAFWRNHKLAGLILLFLSVVACLMLVLPPGQYNHDVLAAVLPLNIMAGLALLLSKEGQGQLPSSASKSA